MPSNIIGFIGAGNMASSMIGGLRQQGFAAEQIWAADPSSAQLQRLADEFAIQTHTDNQVLAATCDTLVLAVKPNICHSAIAQINNKLSDQLLISIAAGITTELLSNWLEKPMAIVRCMPNTPALLGLGASAAFANASTDDTQRALATTLLSSIGICEWVNDEALLDVVTAVSGSGPAYFFLLMEMLQHAAIELGLPETIAIRLIKQTALGAAQMVQTADADFTTRREQVTSPGGTTECAIEHLEQEDIRQIVSRAISAADQRAKQLAEKEAS